MKSLILGLNCLMLASTSLPGIEGINCLYGDTAQSVSRPCPGSCLTVENPSGNLIECFPKRMPDGCKSLYGVKMCFCNKDNCNTGKKTSMTPFIDFVTGVDTGTNVETKMETNTETNKGTSVEAFVGNNMRTNQEAIKGTNKGMLFRFIQFQLQDLGEGKM